MTTIETSAILSYQTELRKLVGKRNERIKSLFDKITDAIADEDIQSLISECRRSEHVPSPKLDTGLRRKEFIHLLRTRSGTSEEGETSEESAFILTEGNHVLFATSPASRETSDGLNYWTRSDTISSGVSVLFQKMIRESTESELRGWIMETLQSQI